VRTFLTKTKRLTEKEGVLAFQLARSSRASTSWQVSPLRRQWNASWAGTGTVVAQSEVLNSSVNSLRCWEYYLVRAPAWQKMNTLI
jgi:hypothetical protein